MVLNSWSVLVLVFGLLAGAGVIMLGGSLMSERFKIVLAVVGVIVTLLIVYIAFVAQYGNAYIRIPF